MRQIIESVLVSHSNNTKFKKNPILKQESFINAHIIITENKTLQS